MNKVKFIKAFFSLVFFSVTVVLLLVFIGFLNITSLFPLKNNLAIDELISAGYKHIVFGSQKTKGIELYDIHGGKFVSFLAPENKNIRYVYPVVSGIGQGFCIKRDYSDLLNQTDELIYFDLSQFKTRPVKNSKVEKYLQLQISHDGKKLALVCTFNKNSKKSLIIIAVDEEKILYSYYLDLDAPSRLVWKSDDEKVVIWQKSPLEAVELNIKTGDISKIKEYPLDYQANHVITGDYSIGKKDVGDIYWDDTVASNRKSIKKLNLPASVNNLQLSRDGKYLIYDWRRDMSSQVITIKEIQTNKVFQLKTDSPGPVLGLALW